MLEVAQWPPSSVMMGAGARARSQRVRLCGVCVCACGECGTRRPAASLAIAPLQARVYLYDIILMPSFCARFCAPHAATA